MKPWARFAGLALITLCVAGAGCSREKVVRRTPDAAVVEDDSLSLGDPGRMTRQTDDPQDYLVERPQFSLSYNREIGGPNWVGWHLQRSDLGRVEREDEFFPDPLLPEAWRIRPGDYSGSGYDRGHQCPAGDRTRRKTDNRATFAMSNMLPQTADLNREVWRRLEEYCRQLVSRGSELYIICGGRGSRERIADGKVVVPRSCWKVIVVLLQGENDIQRIDGRTRVIAVDIPNTNGIESHSWRRYITTVDAIERDTNLDLLSSVPIEIQETLESTRDSGGSLLQKERRATSTRELPR